MKYRIQQIKTDIDVPVDALPGIVAGRLRISEPDIESWEIRRKSIDSRKKPHIQYVYTVDFVTDRKLNPARIPNLSIVDEEHGEVLFKIPANVRDQMYGRPVVVGSGPAGLFAALELAKNGCRPIVIERGPAMSGRVRAVERFKHDRILDPEANMLFGEGGAGTFSDGKLATGIKDGLIRQVLSEFRDAGAGEDIMYLARPHIGTDVLREVIVNIRNRITELGGEFMFNTRLDAFEIMDGRLVAIHTNSTDKTDRHDLKAERIETGALILAIGHSARDTFAIIRDAGIEMEQKPFSIGVRIEHPQRLIDESQYGAENADRFTDAVTASKETGKLPPADYKLSYKASNGRGVYSFCMCPGGEVVTCSTRDGELCVNGMSNRRRGSGYANSGILCDVRKEDFGSDDVLAGVRFQERYERLAFENGGGCFTPPSCSMEDFLKDAEGSDKVKKSLPDFAVSAIREAIPEFARRINRYDHPDARVTAAETRSSSPIRILRDSAGESNIKGIYPAGEGAGYAGGITSAACDGIRAARHVIEKNIKGRKVMMFDKDCGKTHAK